MRRIESHIKMGNYTLDVVYLSSALTYKYSCLYVSSQLSSNLFSKNFFPVFLYDVEALTLLTATLEENFYERSSAQYVMPIISVSKRTEIDNDPDSDMNVVAY